MTGFTIPPIIYYFSIIALFLLFILFYLYRTSEFFTFRHFKRSLFYLLILYLLVLTVSILTTKSEKHFTRIAVMPGDLGNREELIEKWVNAQAISQGLAGNLPDDYLVYPATWLVEAVEMDSLASPTYCTRFAKSIDLDQLLLLRENNNTSTLLIQNLKSGTDTTVAAAGYPDLIAKALNYLYIKPEENIKTVTDTLLTRAKIYLSLFGKRREYEKALDLAEQLYLIDSTNIEYRNLLAETQLTAATYYDYQGKPSGLLKMAALRISERTITTYDSSNATAYRLVGEYYVLEEMWAKAEHFLFRSYEKNPYDPKTLFVLSHLHGSRTAKIGYKGREALLRRAIAINPCFERARIELADYLYFNKWPGQARREIEKLLAIRPNSIEGWLYLGKMAVGESKMDQIISIYNRILEIDPRNVEAFYNLGVYYFNSGDIINATRFFERAIAYGDHLDSHLYLGHIYNQQGEKEKAIAEYRYRIKYKRGFDDPYAEEARKQLYNLTNADSALDAFYGRNRK